MHGGGGGPEVGGKGGGGRVSRSNPHSKSPFPASPFSREETEASGMCTQVIWSEQHTHTHTQTLSLSLNTHTYTHTLSLSLTHTHTHTHTNTHTHTQTYLLQGNYTRFVVRYCRIHCDTCLTALPPPLPVAFSLDLCNRRMTATVTVHVSFSHHRFCCPSQHWHVKSATISDKPISGKISLKNKTVFSGLFFCHVLVGRATIQLQWKRVWWALKCRYFAFNIF